MLVVWGSGNGRSVMGQLPEQECSVCGDTATRTAFVDFKYWHVWYIFSFLVGKTYHQACDSCGTVAEYDKFEAKRDFPRDNIPFIKRYGWLVCAAIVLAVVLFASINSWRNHRAVGALVLEPRVKDLYLAEMNKIQNSGYPFGKERIYGVMYLMSEREDGKFVVATSAEAYGKKSALRKYLAGDSVRFSHDEEDPLLLSKEDLARLYSQKIIFDARRPSAPDASR